VIFLIFAPFELIRCQEMQAKHQQGRLDSIAGDISKLQKNQQVPSLCDHFSSRDQW